jgi:hypothetical protein
MNTASTWVVWWQLAGVLASEVALVALVAALLQRFARSSRGCSTVWQVAVLSLLALPVFELTGVACGLADWMAGRTGIARAGRLGTAGQTEGANPAPALSEEFHRSVAERVALNDRRATTSPRDSQVESVQPLSAPVQPAAARPAARSAQIPIRREADDSLAQALPVLGFWLVWLAGATLVIARGCVAGLLLSWFGWSRKPVANVAVKASVESLSRQLGISRRVRLIESAGLAGPIVFGVFRPTIGLPMDFTERFRPDQREAMLAHELAHLVGNDPLWYRLADLATAILWWHPLAWWARRQLHIASEQAADEASSLVADGPGALAECLVELSGRMTRKRSFVSLGVEGSGFRSGLGRRVERLVDLRENSWAPPRRLRSVVSKTLGPATLAVAVILCTAWVSPRAFTKGESMKTMKQTWSRSLAAAALLASLQEPPESHATEKSAAAEPVNQPGEPSRPAENDDQGQKFQQLLMERRYGAQRYGNPKGATPPAAERPNKKRPIESRLEEILLNEVMFDGLPLSEVLKFLDEESRIRDPDKRGINFLINPNGPPVIASQAVDPTTGQPIALPSHEPVDMNSVIIRFNLPLRNIRLKDVLDAIVKVADKPIEYSVEEYGVVFSQSLNPSTGSPSALTSRSPEQGQLEVRTFMVDTNTFLAGLKRAFGTESDTTDNATTERIRSTLRDVFTRLGINMDVAGKTVFYNDLTGIVMVRATPEDLEIVRAAIETLGGSGIGQFAQPGPAKDGAQYRYNEEMMRRYGLLPKKP